MPEKQDIQLLPETKRSMTVKVPGENKLLFIGAVVLVCILAGSYLIVRMKNSEYDRLLDLDKQLISIEEQRSSSEEERLLSLSKQLKIINTVMANHLYWTQGLSKFQSIISEETGVKNLSIAYSGDEISVDFPAKALNYISVARQLAAFLADTDIKSVNMGGITIAEGLLEFNVSLKIDSKKYLFKE
jgi:hypothetical protein